MEDDSSLKSKAASSKLILKSFCPNEMCLNSNRMQEAAAAEEELRARGGSAVTRHQYKSVAVQLASLSGCLTAGVALEAPSGHITGPKSHFIMVLRAP